MSRDQSATQDKASRARYGLLTSQDAGDPKVRERWQKRKRLRDQMNSQSR